MNIAQHIPKSLRTFSLVIVTTALSVTARAGWDDLRRGQDASTVIELVGLPLFQTRGCKGALASWNYDAGGFAFFENGRLSYWQQPRPATDRSIAAKSTGAPTGTVAPKSSAGAKVAAVSKATSASTVPTAAPKAKPATATLLAAR